MVSDARKGRESGIAIRLSPFQRVILGLVLGLFCGLVFGERAGFLEIAGNAYIRLLQMTVLPYILVSLVGGLGRLDAAMARRIGFRGGSLILVLWAATLLTLVCLPLAYPDWTAASFFSASQEREAAPFDPLTLYIPANPFFSLANTIVPAVVLFSIGLGLALIAVPDKDGLLKALQNLSDALMRMASFIAKLAPLGIFAITAAAAGTLRVEELSKLQVYLWVYLATWLILTFLTLPVLVARSTSFSYREVLREAREPMVTAFAAGTVLVVLPMIAEKAKALLREHDLESDEADTAVDVLTPTTYSFPSAGGLLGLGFILFAAWYHGSPLSLSQYPSFVVVGALTSFGTMPVAGPFMLDFFRLPADLFQLYLLGSVVTARFATGLAAVHGIAICLLGASAMRSRIPWRMLTAVVSVCLVITGLAMFGLRFVLTRTIPYEYTGDQAIVGFELLTEPVATVSVDDPSPLAEEELAQPRLDIVSARGSLRVGFVSDSLPFAFRNSEGRVVGFDLDLAHSLARDLGVSLELVRVSPEAVVEVLQTGRVDLLVGGIAVLPDLAAKFDFSRPYLDQTLAFLVPDHERRRFASLAQLRRRQDLRIGIPSAPYYEELLRQRLPDAEFVPIDSPRQFLRGERQGLDAVVYTAEAGSAWTIIYPDYSAVTLDDLDFRIPIAFGLPTAQPSYLHFLNTWLELTEKSGLMTRLYGRWILGRVLGEGRQPRWSLVDEVIGDEPEEKE